MPRKHRNFLPGIPLHIIQRGNNRQVCFYTERDYVVYLDKLYEYSEKLDVAIHSYVLMTNHVHLLLSPANTYGASQLLQSLGRYYVRYINATYNRTGTLWEGRFKASMINSEQYLLTVSRYIELNPVRANMIDHPAEYPWSSYHQNALGKKIKLITSHAVYNSLGNNKLERQLAYQSLFVNHIPDYTVEEIRKAANKGWVVGDARFKQQIEKQLGYSIPPLPRGGDRKSGDFHKSGRIKQL